MTTVTDSARSDARLVQAYVQGDREALATLVGRRYDEAYRYFLRVLGDPARADDAAQDAFVALIQGARRFQPGRAFGPWWGGILANTARDAGRSARRRRRREQRVARRDLAEVADAGQDAERAEIDAQVRALPESLRAPLTLHFYQGLTHREVARSLGCPPGTASSRIRRGLERLRGQLSAAGHAALVPQLERLLGEPSSALPPRGRPDARTLQAEAARSTAAALLVKAGVVVCLALALGLGLASSRRPAGSSAAAPSSSVARGPAPAPSGDVTASPPAQEPPEAWARATLPGDASAEVTLAEAGEVTSGGVRGEASEPAFDPAREGLLRVRCLDDQGEPVPAGRVELVPVDAVDRPLGGGAQRLELHAGHAVVALPAGRYRYTVDCGESYGSELEREPGGAGHLDLVVGERRLLQLDLVRMVEVHVSALDLPEGAWRQLDTAVESRWRGFYGNSIGPQGEQVVHAWPGEVSVTLLDAQRGVFARERFRAEPGERRDCALRLDQAAPCRLTGVVRGAGDQLPLGRAQVSAFGRGRRLARASTQPDGTFQVWTIEPVTRVRVDAPACVDAEVEVEDPTRGLVVELEREGAVAIELLTPGGRPADGFEIEARWTRADGQVLYAGSRADALGVYEATLVEGTYTVEIEGVARAHEVIVRGGETVRFTARLVAER